MDTKTKLALLSGSSMLFGILSVVSDLVYRFFKIGGRQTNPTVSFCFYDNFFYGWYYRLSAVAYFAAGGLLLFPAVSVENVERLRALSLIPPFNYCSLSKADNTAK